MPVKIHPLGDHAPVEPVSPKEQADGTFIAELKRIVEFSRSRAYAAINFAHIGANWLIGRRIVEQEQYGEKRAEYGARIVELAAQELTAEFGKGFSKRNLRRYRRFYLLFNELPIRPTLLAKSPNPAITPNLASTARQIQIHPVRGEMLVETAHPQTCRPVGTGRARHTQQRAKIPHTFRPYGTAGFSTSAFYPHCVPTGQSNPQPLNHQPPRSNGNDR